MRPIVSSINSPTHLMSKRLQNKLLKLEKCPTNSINSRYEFINEIKDIHIEDNSYLVTLSLR